MVQHDTFLIQSFNYKTRPEPLTTETPNKFNLLTLNESQIWDVVVFLLTNHMRVRYVRHEVEEHFRVIHNLKRIQTGHVEYYLKIYYIAPR